MAGRASGPIGGSGGSGSGGPGAPVDPVVSRAMEAMLRVLRRRARQPHVFDFQTEDTDVFKTLLGTLEQRRDAAVDGGQIRELAGFLVDGQLGTAMWALSVLQQLVLSRNEARVVALMEVDGVARALCGLLRVEGDPLQLIPQFSAAQILRRVSFSDAALEKLLWAARDFPAAALQLLVDSLPRDAAARFGFDQGAPLQYERQMLLDAAIWMLMNITDLVQRATCGRDVAITVAVAARVARTWTLETRAVPALLAAMEGGDEATVDIALRLITAAAELDNRSKRQCFWLSQLLVPRLEEALGRHLRMMDVGEAASDGTAEWLMPLVWQSLSGPLAFEPKRLLGAQAGAWVAAAPRLRALYERLAAAILDGRAGDTTPRGLLQLRAEYIRAGVKSLELLVHWREVSFGLAAGAGTLAPSAGSSSSSSSRGGGSTGGGGGSLLRRCAGCGATRADGAHLRRCRGCGDLTGVMYCGQACAREHWVKRGHRQLCERGRAKLEELREAVDEVNTAVGEVMAAASDGAGGAPAGDE